MTILLAPPPASTTDPLAVILPHLHNLASTDLAATNLAATRRGLLLAPLLAALPLGFLTDPAATESGKAKPRPLPMTTGGVRPRVVKRSGGGGPRTCAGGGVLS
jgi:hypothetical protein